MQRTLNSASLSTPLPSVLHSFHRMFWSVGLFGACINLLMLAGPLFMLQVYDRVLTSGSAQTLVALLLLVAGLFSFMGLLDIIRSRIMIRMGWWIDENLCSRVFDQVLHHALKKTSRVYSQPHYDLETVRVFFSGPGFITLFDALWAPVFLAVIFLMHPWLGLFALLGACILVLLALVNELMTRAPLEQAQRSSIAAHAFAEESRRNAEVVQAMGMRANILQHWRKLRKTAIRDQNSACDFGGDIAGFSKALRMLLQSAMLALGAFLAIRQEITPGAMIASSIIMSRALSPVELSIVHWRSFLDYRRARRRLIALFERAPVQTDPVLLPSPKGNIQVRNLSVFAGDQRKPLLQGINFKLSPGSAIGVIGPTGSGKSTLARVLAGVWPVQKGIVAIDGSPLEHWNSTQIGRAIGYLPQDIELFSGTIAENISRFTPNAKSHDIVAAAQLANVHELIMRLPSGYQTRIGEGGETLSAGQRQRIGLARALYGNPVVIILDEPNANLDIEGEIALVKAMMALKEKGATVVVIAHRPSAINTVDFLLHLKNGVQIDFAPKDKLLKKLGQVKANDYSL